MNYSPLRYPGGKNKIAALIRLIIEKAGSSGITYIEPFAGGAGVALSLLIEGTVDQIVINDYDKAMWITIRSCSFDRISFFDLTTRNRKPPIGWFFVSHRDWTSLSMTDGGGPFQSHPCSQRSGNLAANSCGISIFALFTQKFGAAASESGSPFHHESIISMSLLGVLSAVPFFQ